MKKIITSLTVFILCFFLVVPVYAKGNELLINPGIELTSRVAVIESLDILVAEIHHPHPEVDRVEVDDQVDDQVDDEGW
ncbi:hypothetical protein VQL36_04205 [Chengkuizengella sp. SCS-71B]|uniref:hypothetical protein n=1 Tax=Chengkuizengella sp. SCS-71B TaxID=3115290 RepID=UPI0032C22967